jgi:hypothetical protein
MKPIDHAPFPGKFIGLGVNSCDSVVGRLSVRYPQPNEDTVIKWSRRDYDNSKQAMAAATFVCRTHQLCIYSLGKEFVVPTMVVVGQKTDNGRLKHKVYISQPHIDSWTSQDMTNEQLSSTPIQRQWQTLRMRLANLYQTVDGVNSAILGTNKLTFPLTLTLGSFRSSVHCGEIPSNVPKTPNILIRKGDQRLLLCDFGEYKLWDENMEEAYRQIVTSLSQGF